MSVSVAGRRGSVLVAYALFILVGLATGAPTVLIVAQMADYGVGPAAIGLMFFTLLGAMVKLDRYVRSQDAPFGFGPPSEIEIITDGLNVRSAPSDAREREKVLGTVARGSRHEVLEQANNNWIRIRVRSWATKEPGVETNQGWIFGDLDGNPPKVRVVSRKFWGK